MRIRFTLDLERHRPAEPREPAERDTQLDALVENAGRQPFGFTIDNPSPFGPEDAR